MSGCALKRWGTGTPCTREPDTAAKKEMAARLEIMRAEREKQDTMWSVPVAEPLQPVQPAAKPVEPVAKPVAKPVKYTSS